MTEARNGVLIVVVVALAIRAAAWLIDPLLPVLVVVGIVVLIGSAVFDRDRHHWH